MKKVKTKNQFFCKKTISRVIGLILIFQLSNVVFDVEPQLFAAGSNNVHPGKLTGQQMVYDPITAEIVMFGGNRGNSEQSPLNSIWKFSIATSEWSEIIQEVYPIPRFNHRMVYLPENHSILLFGGTKISNYERLADTWVYHLDTNLWENLAPSTNPTARSDPGLIYDTLRDRVILFGGYGYNDVKQNDVWEYNPKNNTWTEQNPIFSPPVQYGHSFFYRGVNGMAYIFGGHVNGYTNDIRKYNSTSISWNSVSTGYPEPSERYWHCMEYSNESDVGLLFGGDDGNSQGDALDDTWIYNFTANSWEAVVSETSPPGRLVFSMCLDSDQNQMYIYGGLAEDFSVTHEDLWKFDFETLSWEKISDRLSSSIDGYSGLGLISFSSIILCFSKLSRKEKKC